MQSFSEHHVFQSADSKVKQQLWIIKELASLDCQEVSDTESLSVLK